MSRGVSASLALAALGAASLAQAQGLAPQSTVLPAGTPRWEHLPLGPPPSDRAPKPDEPPLVDETIAADPEKLQAEADRAFDAREWLGAIACYRVLRERHPGPRARAAELRLADIAFERARWGEAHEGYRRFVEHHPVDAAASRAAWRAAQAALRGASFGGAAPSPDRDPSLARDAWLELRAFAAAYPEARELPEARRQAASLAQTLAAHELLVARFDAGRGAWRGVLARTDVVSREYPGSGRLAEALLLRVKACSALREPAEARAVLARLRALPAPDTLVKEAEGALGDL